MPMEKRAFLVDFIEKINEVSHIYPSRFVQNAEMHFALLGECCIFSENVIR